MRSASLTALGLNLGNYIAKFAGNSLPLARFRRVSAGSPLDNPTEIFWGNFFVSLALSGIAIFVMAAQSSTTSARTRATPPRVSFVAEADGDPTLDSGTRKALPLLAGPSLCYRSVPRR